MAAASWFSGIPDRSPWLLERGLDCILSPDCDGFLCGLLMSRMLGWKVRGFYNGRILAVDESVNHRECVFLDMEIYRPDVRSVGQHMLMFDNRPGHLPDTWGNFGRCVSPNNLRGFDFRQNFARKYPLATVHLLMAALSARGMPVPVQSGAVAPLLYVDGTFKNTMNYPENCLDWLTEMDCENNEALRAVFCGGGFSPWTLMSEMSAFFDLLRKEVADKNPDRLILNDSKGKPVNLRNGGIVRAEREKVQKFLRILAKKTKWKYSPNAWTCWENLRVIRLKDVNFSPKVTDRNPANPGFKTRVESGKPISWAITGAQRGVEMTLSHPKF